MVLTKRHRIKLAVAAMLALVALAGEADWGWSLRDSEAFWTEELQRREWALHRARTELAMIRAESLDVSGPERAALAEAEAAAWGAVVELERSVGEARQKLQRNE